MIHVISERHNTVILLFDLLALVHLGLSKVIEILLSCIRFWLAMECIQLYLTFPVCTAPTPQRVQSVSHSVREREREMERERFTHLGGIGAGV